jgi:hypothetical protein
MQRRKPLRRKTPLKRTAWKLTGKSAKRKRKHVNSYRKRQRFPAWMIWVRSLPCVISTLPIDRASDTPSDDPCSGWNEADHIGPRAMGRKSHDFEVLPACKKHHDARPGRRGPFARLDRQAMRSWIVVALADLHRRASLVNAPDAEARRAWLNGDGRIYLSNT